ncbi:unnamed protein product [Ectocarpus sp. 12 AP-2014]
MHSERVLVENISPRHPCLRGGASWLSRSTRTNEPREYRGRVWGIAPLLSLRCDGLTCEYVSFHECVSVCGQNGAYPDGAPSPKPRMRCESCIIRTGIKIGFNLAFWQHRGKKESPRAMVTL